MSVETTTTEAQQSVDPHRRAAGKVKGLLEQEAGRPAAAGRGAAGWLLRSALPAVLRRAFARRRRRHRLRWRRGRGRPDERPVPGRRHDRLRRRIEQQGFTIDNPNAGARAPAATPSTTPAWSCGARARATPVYGSGRDGVGPARLRPRASGLRAVLYPGRGRGRRVPVPLGVPPPPSLDEDRNPCISPSRLDRDRPPDALPRPLRGSAPTRPAPPGVPVVPGGRTRHPPRRRGGQHRVRHAQLGLNPVLVGAVGRTSPTTAPGWSGTASTASRCTSASCPHRAVPVYHR